MPRLGERLFVVIPAVMMLASWVCSAQPPSQPKEGPPTGQPGTPVQGDVYQTGNAPGCSGRGDLADRCCEQKARLPKDPRTRQYGMPIQVPFEQLNNGTVSATIAPPGWGVARVQCATCAGDSCTTNGALCWGCQPRKPGDVYQSGGNNGRPPDVYQSGGKPGSPPNDVYQSGGRCQPSQIDQSGNATNRRPVQGADGICTLQQLAAAVMQRYRTGFPIGIYSVVNSTSSTYLVTLQGVERDRRGQATMAGDAYLAWWNVKPLDAYYMAIIDAVKKAIPKGGTLIIAGHSLGGIQAQNVVAELSSSGYKVAQVVSFGAPIQNTVVAGTKYLNVRAQNEALQRYDQRTDLSREFTNDCVQMQGIMFSGMGTGPIYGPTGSHNNFAQDSSGLNRRRVPPIATLTSQCYEVKWIQAFAAPDLATRATGGKNCLPPPKLGQPKCAFQLKDRLPASCGLTDPKDRGLLLDDENFLKQAARELCQVILVRDSSLAALSWAGKPGYKPKPQDIKGKTLKASDLNSIGIPPDQQNQYLGLASARGMSSQEQLDLTKKGYRIAGAAQLIEDSAGNKFYSDTDLAGVYDANGKNAWTDNMLNILQCGTLDQGIQHAPHDNWADRNNPAKAGANYGPQIGQDPSRDCQTATAGGGDKPCKSITAIFPDGTTFRVCSLTQMKQLYKAIGVDFNSVYPGF